MSSTSPWRRARSAASPLPLIGPSRSAEAASAVGWSTGRPRYRRWPRHVACDRGDAFRDHRRRSCRQHRGHLRRPARRPGDHRRARRDRWRRPLVGLHPVQDDDRDGWGDELPPSLDGHGARAGQPRGRHRGPDLPHRGDQEPPAARHRPAAAESGRPARQRHGAVRRSALGAGLRGRRARRGDRVRQRPDLYRVAAAHSGLVHARRRPHPHHARLLPAEGVPRQHHRHRLRRDGRGVRPHVLVVRRQGLPRRLAPAGPAGQGR